MTAKIKHVGAAMTSTIVLTLLNLSQANAVVPIYNSPQDYFSLAIAEAPTSTLIGSYDYIAPVAGISTGKVSSSNASIVSPVTSYVDPSSLVGSGSGLSQASVNRNKGQLHASAGVLSNYQFASRADAFFGETLHFQNINATDTTITTIHMNFHLDGTLGDFLPGAGYTSSGLASVTLFMTIGNLGYSGGPFNGFNTIATNIVTPGGIFENIYGGPATIDNDYTTTLSFIGRSASASLLAELYVSGQYQYSDFSNTASFSFAPLPTGVSYTSASGSFLTGGVPEPSTWIMMLLGFAGLGFAGYRSSRMSNMA